MVTVITTSAPLSASGSESYGVPLISAAHSRTRSGVRPHTRIYRKEEEEVEEYITEMEV